MEWKNYLPSIPVMMVLSDFRLGLESIKFTVMYKRSSSIPICPFTKVYTKEGFFTPVITTRSVKKSPPFFDQS